MASLKALLKKQWANIVGAAASSAAFIYNVFKPTRLSIVPQSGLSDVVVAHPVTVGLGTLGVLGLLLFGSLFLYKARKHKGAR